MLSWLLIYSPGYVCARGPVMNKNEEEDWRLMYIRPLMQLWECRVGKAQSFRGKGFAVKNAFISHAKCFQTPPSGNYGLSPVLRGYEIISREISFPYIFMENTSHAKWFPHNWYEIVSQIIKWVVFQHLPIHIQFMRGPTDRLHKFKNFLQSFHE